MESTHSARIYDLASHRLQRRSQLRRRSGERRQFLWSSPGGQVQAIEFPFAKAAPAPAFLRVR